MVQPDQGPYLLKVPLEGALIIIAYDHVLRIVDVDALAREVKLGEAAVLPPVLEHAGQYWRSESASLCAAMSNLLKSSYKGLQGQKQLSSVTIYCSSASGL